MHLDHLRYRRYVDAYVDGELEGDLRRRVIAHLMDCERCGERAQLTVQLKYDLARRDPFDQ